MSSSWSLEVECAVSAPRLFKAAVMEWHNLAPKAASDKVVSAVPIEGDGKAGSIRQFNFVPGSMPFSFVKERLDFIDIEKCEVKTTLIEGGPLVIYLESTSSQITIEPKDGGCVAKIVSTYTPLPAFEEKGIDMMKQECTGLFKAAEAYLAANPDAYN
ncbi:hypothetical protein LUZ60_013887 [Juncus effusus]|nr:hypothetical protein LUZ60_013887 [Juncus effusus]